MALLAEAGAGTEAAWDDAVGRLRGREVRLEARATCKKDLPGVLEPGVEGEAAAEVVAEEEERAGKWLSSVALKGGPEEDEEEEEVEEEEEELPAELSSAGSCGPPPLGGRSCRKGQVWGRCVSSSSIPSRHDPKSQCTQVVVAIAWLKAQSDRAQKPAR